MPNNLNIYNVQKLTASKDEFLVYAKEIEKKFTGPSAYFYQKVIEELRETNNYASLFDNIKFIEHIYATLTSWGMHRMDQNTRMSEFPDFKKNLIQNRESFIQLSKEKLRTADLPQLKSIILNLFNSLKIMGRNDAPKFVANSKVMHFLLPDLIPPMDKRQIYHFFYGRIKDNGKKSQAYIKNENETFWEILLQFRVIADKLDLKETDLKGPWDTSIPKIIDNAIIGFNLSR